MARYKGGEIENRLMGIELLCVGYNIVPSQLSKELINLDLNVFWHYYRRRGDGHSMKDEN